MGKAKVNKRSKNNEEVKAIPCIRKVIFESKGAKFETEFSDKEEGEEEVENIQEVCVPFGLMIYLR